MAAVYELARVAVDPVVFTVSGSELLVLLNVREKPPYARKHELPGGILLKGETPDGELRRKLRQLFGGKDVYFTQFKTFFQPNRDPRMRTISVGFIALVPEEVVADKSGWFPISRLPPLAFDHSNIIDDAKSYLKHNISILVAKQLLPSRFPLNQLQRIYEAIEEKRYDNRNFRKKMISEGVVVHTSGFLANRSYRPPRLYRFSASAL